MNSSQSTRRFRFALAFLVFVWAGLAGAQPSRPSTERLRAKARQAGSVRVIVELAPERRFRPEGLLPASERSAQRAGIASVQRRLREGLASRGARVLAEYRVIPYSTLVVDEGALDELEKLPFVSGVTEDLLLRPLLDSSIPVIRADVPWSYGVTGTGQAVAILDTGVETSHPFFGGRVVSEACYSTTSLTDSATTLCPNNQASMTGPGAASPTKCSGTNGCDHGTHVAGIAAGSGSSFNGVAPGASIIAVQVFSKFTDPGECGGAPSCVLSYTSDQLSALQRVYDLRSSFSIAAVNLSLGGGEFSATCDDFFPSYTAIIESLRSVGIATVVASGNENRTNGTGFPACITSAVTVGASTDIDTVPFFSNSASWVDALAPGVAIQSSILGDGFGFKSGTSMATPHVTGTWALLKSISPAATVTEIRDALRSTGPSLFDPKSGVATPRIDVSAAHDVVEANAPPRILTNALPDAFAGTAYSSTLEARGGTPPRTFQLVSGSLAQGLNGPTSAGLVSGTPTQAGQFTFRARVRDAVGRSSEKNISHTVRLRPPVLLGPSGPINNPTPTFLWAPSVGAALYDLVVDNLTDARVELQVMGISGTSHTASTALTPNRMYRFTVRATAGAVASDYAAYMSFELDTSPPPRTVDLAGRTPSALPLTGLVVAGSSGSIGSDPRYGADKLVDGDLASVWASPARSSMTTEHVTLDLGSRRWVGAVRLRSREDYGSLMPRAFTIELGDEFGVFVTARTVSGFTAPANPAAWYAFDFTPGSGRYVRLRFTETNRHTDSNYYVSFSELGVWQAAPDGSLEIEWTAPGDDEYAPGVSRASAYEIRYRPGTGPTIDFPNATPFASVPSPSAAGTREVLLLSGLGPQLSHEVALRSRDDAGNDSLVSNTVVVRSSGPPPGPISDLRTAGATISSLSLEWTAPASDGSTGAAVASYEIRYSTSVVFEENFHLASAVTPTPTPGAPGTGQNVSIANLQSHRTYYVAIRSVDAEGNRSLLSNVVAATTLDDIPPSAVSDLRVSFPDDDALDLLWTASGDDGSVGTAQSYDIRYATVLIREETFSSANPVVVGLQPKPSGSPEKLLVTGLSPATDYFFALKVVDESGNASPISNVVSVRTHDDLPEPMMVSPAPGATLPGSSATFRWTANGGPIDEWWVYLGRTQGGAELADSRSLGGALSFTAAGLPTDGSDVFLRLWYRVGSFWGHANFQFVASDPPPLPKLPEVVSPTPGSVLSGTSVVFEWRANDVSVTEWWIYAGSAPGASSYFDSGSLGSSLTATLTGLPGNGGPVHVRLWYRASGTWSFVDQVYTAATAPPPATPSIVTPASGATLAGSVVTFQWASNGTPVQEWWLFLGASPGASGLFDSGSLGAALSVSATGLPTNGSTIYARLWYRVAGLWSFRDDSYTAATIAASPPAIDSPAPGTTLLDSTVAFQWSANGTAVSEWWLYAGSSPGAKNFFDSGSLPSTLSVQVTGLPANGTTVHVRLWYRVSGLWQFFDAVYTAVSRQPALVTPAPGATLSGSSVLFTWTANGAGVTEWWLYAGPSPGASSYFDSGSLGSALSTTVTGLPANGSTVRVRLWYRIAGLWSFQDYAFTSGP